MKATIIAVVVVVMMAVALAFRNSDPITYVKEQVEVIKEVEVQPDWAKDEDAVKAAQAVIRKKELEAQIADLDTKIKALQDERKTAAKELEGY